MLTDAKLRTLKYSPLESKGAKNAGQLLPNRYPDRDGMYISVSPTGTISFRYDFRWEGRRQCLTHGRYPLMSLEQARAAQLAALRKIKEGSNPLDERRQGRATRGLDDSFKAVAERWYEKNKPGKSDSWLESNRRHLNAAYQSIGQRKMRDIAPQDVSAIITPVEAAGKAITAEQMRQTYVSVFDYAAGKEFLITTGANPARVLSVDTPASTHHPHLSYSDIQGFFKAVDADTGAEQVRLAVKLLFLTLTRKMELAGAKWSEVDLEAARWQIPAERMKGRRAHIVPLSQQAVTLFRRLKELAGESAWVFPHRDRTDRGMADDTINRLFTRIGYAGKATPHGCRSTASTILNELGYRSDVIERQLSHIEADEVRASYNHADYMTERRAMLQDWADCIDRLCAGKPLREANVIQIGSSRAA